MLWSARTKVITLALVVVAALAAALSPLPGNRAHAQIDLTGRWDIHFVVMLSGDCNVAIMQTGTDLLLVGQCDIAGSGSLEGTIDPDTGQFTLSGSLSGIGAVIEGTASEDGNSVTGTVGTDLLGIAGTFTGTRTSTDPDLMELSGNWRLFLDGDLAGSCAAAFEQPSLLELSAALDCGELGSGSLAGDMNPVSGGFAIHGSLGEATAELIGTLAETGSSMEGYFWSSSAPGSPEAYGQFLGVPENETARGIMAVDCDGDEAGRQRNCSHAHETSFDVQVHVLAPPDDGYTGFQTDLGWSNTTLDYAPAPDPNDEVLWPPCDAAERPESGPDRVLLRCASPESDLLDTFAGPIVRLQMTCPEESSATLELLPSAGDGGTHFLDTEGGAVEPLLIGAEVYCYGPGRGGPGRLIEPSAPDGEGDQSQGSPTLAATPAATPTAQALALPDTGSSGLSGGSIPGGNWIFMAMVATTGVVLLALSCRRVRKER